MNPVNDPLLKQKRWTIEEDDLLLAAVKKYGKNWTKIAESMPQRTDKQCQDRWKKINGDGAMRPPEVPKNERKKITTTWTLSEDILLLQLVERFGKDWEMIKDKVKTKEAIDCKRRYERLRESEYDPDYEDKDLLDVNYFWSPEDDAILTFVHRIYEGDMCKIAKRFPDRSKQHIKERWDQLAKPAESNSWTPDQDAKLLRAYLQYGNFTVVAKELLKTVLQCEDRFKKVLSILNQGFKKPQGSGAGSSGGQEAKKTSGISVQSIIGGNNALISGDIQPRVKKDVIQEEYGGSQPSLSEKYSNERYNPDKYSSEKYGERFYQQDQLAKQHQVYQPQNQPQLQVPPQLQMMPQVSNSTQSQKQAKGLMQPVKKSQNATELMRMIERITFALETENHLDALNEVEDLLVREVIMSAN